VRSRFVVARAAFVATFALVVVGAIPRVMAQPPATAGPAQPPATAGTALVLQRYADALATIARPANMVFEITVDQSGIHNFDETHRIYRSGLHERDETLALAGTSLKIPLVRVRENAYKYDVLTLAPKPAEYVFKYSGMRVVAGRTVYAFRTDSALPSSFAVTDVLIDGQHFLPTVIAFVSTGNGMKGKGRVTFAPSGHYWVARDVSVTATSATGKVARERIVWSKYRFPESLPASTFSAPKPVATDLP
jgi:hypothetical protein